MTEHHVSTSKGVFDATVVFNRKIGDCFYRLGMVLTGDGAKAFAGLCPGRFVQLNIADTALPSEDKIPPDLLDKSKRSVLLRRPFSFCDVKTRADKSAKRTADKTFVEILYCVLGPATLRMTSLAEGDTVNMMGPLGRGFWIPEDKKTALLVIGGLGAGPIIHLAKVLSKNYTGIEVIAFVGAKTIAALPFEDLPEKIGKKKGDWISELARYNVQSFITTDDGSAGSKGFVTDCLANQLKKTKTAVEDMILYSCGPEAMLAKVAQVAEDFNIDCQLSTERRMACGIGICQSCAVECRVPDSNETIYKLCCEDGPVFESKELVFSQ